MSKVFQGKFKLKYKEEEQFKVDQFHQFKKTLVSFILTGPYVTKKSEAKQLL